MNLANLGHDPMPEGVLKAPLYQYVPCEDTTAPLADHVVMELRAPGMGMTPLSVELVILRFLVDNNLRIVRVN